ncbi:MAG: hypothetical protein IIV81_03135, partial [Clostridia bacterium]|nr:hypothetical protein [Clostridia bacterium]
IDKFYGGYRFFVGEKEKFDYANNTIKEFRPEYLEAGDIIISAQSDVRGYNNLSSSFKIIKVLVYDGERLLSVRKSSSGVTYKIYQKDEIKKELTKLLANVNDLFFALRPSQTK